ncbi:hypothetical protein NUU61_004497 [Penicillium alfredii]|uniref:Ubiquitin-protein ligase (Asi3) n=1 Tax=Penicillium alfredii TaxID=1506179 RepID=A0A9W9FLT1_9EURO|nr:uncharacterized protein NUU61_004497 [Penicillium alfredii]KAJ5102275.1 hypothetical protein NUU61_004497 [Penicillium alfredii]
MSVVAGPSTVSSTSGVPLMQKLNTSASAIPETSSLSPLKVLLFPLRALYRAENFVFSTVPRHIVTGIQNTSRNFWGGAASTARGAGLAGDAAAAGTQGAGAGVADAASQAGGLYVNEFLQAMRKVGGFFGYLTSIWFFACMVEGLVLNRITIYASTRRHLRLGWERRLALRIIPILLFVSQIVGLLRAIRCQTCPSYSVMRYGKPGKKLVFDYASGGGVLHSLSSSLLAWESDQLSCSAVQMSRATNASPAPFGSFSFLWPMFLLLCFSHFVETLSCALQGRPVMTETGMSIFEHSLAFAEAESMISNSVGLGMLGLPKQSPLNEGASGDESASPLQLLTKSQVLERMNATPELLLIALISCCNSLSSHVLEVFGKQSKYRLFNTAFWGCCFMAAMLWGLQSGPPVSNETGVLKFPTVCIVGFIPHLLVLAGIGICFAIYALALLITAFSLPLEDAQSISFRERLALAHDNMQGSNQIRSIRINRHEDFYTTLLRIGYVALTAASEAVFLNEGKGVVARRMTWLEEDRLTEIETTRNKAASYGHWSDPSSESPFEAMGLANFDAPEDPSVWETGYKRERKVEKPKNGARPMRSQTELGGIGAMRASVRLWHVLDRLGISARPQWLKRLTGPHQKKPSSGKISHSESLDFWILTEDGELELPDNHEFDVELEMRKREHSNRQRWEEPDERRLDEKLYDWWKAGGSWGNQDYTADYNPPVDDDDTTSVVSMSTNASESEWEDYPSDGRRTPTQSNPFPAEFSRESTPLQDPLIDMSTFARRYQKHVEVERSRILLSSRLHRSAGMQPGPDNRKPTAEEESEILERLILSRRSEPPSNSDPHSWESGATGLGPNGPPCVVCQTSPRAIITWPCRCLCICEDCRVSLAMNNFGTCVTCRQEVDGFMRLWVP